MSHDLKKPEGVREELFNDWVDWVSKVEDWRLEKAYKVPLDGVMYEIIYNPSLSRLYIHVIGKSDFRLIDVDLLSGIPIVSLAKLQDAMDEMIVTSVIES